MKSALKLVLLCMVLLGATAAARAQTEDRLTAEKEEVIELAKKFSERYEQTKSLQPLIGEFFTPHFNRNLRKSPYFTKNSFYQVIDLEVAKVDNSSLRRFYVGFTDVSYLSATWIWQNRVDESSDDFVPANVKKVIKREKLLAALLGSEDSADDSDEALLFSSTADLERATLRLEEIRRLYQRHLRLFPNKKSSNFARKYAEFEGEVDRYFDPSGRPCTDFCFGLDMGSMVYEVTVPPYHLLFIGKVDGEMKILEILLFDD